MSLLPNWLFWRDMHCTLNSTYTSSLVTTEAMGSITVFDSKLIMTVKFEKVYLSFQAFGILGYKDTTTSTTLYAAVVEIVLVATTCYVT